MGDDLQKPTHRFQTEELRIDPGPPRLFASAEQKTVVVTLGTSTPSPNPYRLGPAGMLIVNETPYLIDAGVGVLRGLAKLSAAHDMRYVDCVAPKKLSRLFLTHLHSDHVVGLPDLILSPWIFGRTEPLSIYGPPGVKKMVEHIIEAFQVDIHERIHGPERANQTGIQVNVHEFSNQGMIYEDPALSVEAFSHEHGDLNNFGFRFTSADRVVVWAGDGKVGEKFRDACQGADVLVSELCTQKNLGNAPWGGMDEVEKEKIIWAYHLKPRELAQLASAAAVKLLVLTHESNYSSPYDPLALVDEIKEYYSGKVISARDSDIF
jgi:ribonuclease BN (tRNA processing enzyme)